MNIELNNKNNYAVINEQFDFDSCSLIDAAMMVESELTGVPIKKCQDELTLQHIVIKSKLSTYQAVDKDKLQAFLEIIYKQQAFTGDWQSFFDVKNALISKVLSRRKGIPISLGIILLDLLAHCDFEVQGICFPSGFLIRICLDDELLYLDPFTGELQSWEMLELKLRGQLGNHARLTLDLLKPDSNKSILMRLINVTKQPIFKLIC
ncbi:transglutaminase-like domain-containing protein [Psychromonas sp. MME2]|uniref:transglutaminase-like domain-containing protein n=1 Tax=Psychromonas sp. MME2 TaxID=3231033 RepID=UPI00339C715A